MIGWYVHHQGLGHLHRARAAARELRDDLTVLSSLPRPRDWTLPWVALPSDDDGPVRDPEAGGALHWAPVHHDGQRERMAAISAWLLRARPRALVSDVSVEVTLLARLHGVPVVSVVLPGDRSDPAHRLGYAVSSGLVACWPPGVACLVENLPAAASARLRAVGALSRFAVAPPRPRRPGRPRVVVLLGSGGDDVTSEQLARARATSADWEWTVLGRPPGTWAEDPFEVLCDADVVVTHAGESALAEVAAARRPAVVVPGRRPHGEQQATARALAAGPWPAVVRERWPSEWGPILEEAAGLDGGRWSSWCDGRAATRLARVVEAVAASSYAVGSSG